MQLLIGVSVGFIIALFVAGGISHPSVWFYRVLASAGFYALGRIYSSEVNHVVDATAKQFYVHALSWAHGGPHNKHSPLKCDECLRVFANRPN